MADSYCQFSEQIPLKNEKQREWVRSKKYLAERLIREEKMTLQKAREASPEDLVDVCYDTSYGGEGFESEVDKDGWWIYSTEYGDPGAAAEAVQDFMIAFDISKPFVLNWACTCSKPRLGEFYGGAVIVRQGGIEYINASDIARDKVLAK